MRRWLRMLRAALAPLGFVVGASACNRADAAHSTAELVHVVSGFSFPEGVRYDAQQDIFFVSCMQGYGSEKDGRAYIARVHASDPAQNDIFVQSGANGVTLDAPKGMALQGDTLWFADIDVVRGFHRRTGAPIGTVDLTQHDVIMLNDVALGPDGALYVTDTGIIMSRVGVAYFGGSKIFRIAPGRIVSVVAGGHQLAHPNGITWDSAGARWIVVTFHPSLSEVYALAAGAALPKRVLARGLGRYDGVEALPDGRLLVTSWSDSSVHVIAGRHRERVIRDIWQPADLGMDTRRGRIAVPRVLQGLVEIWALPGTPWRARREG